MSELATIETHVLDRVMGGQNVEEGEGNIGVTAPTRRGGTVQVGVQGRGRRTRTDYAVCVDNYRQMGGEPSGLRAACGLPNGQP
ncbi:MAG TPA: hypothetical protein VIV11_14410 [Kofleriaceae bacterium]